MTLHWTGFGWRPQGGEERQWRDLRPGDLIPLNRKIWSVAEVRDVPEADWDDADHEAYAAARARGCPREEWPLRPLYLTVIPANGGDRRGLRVQPYRILGRAWVLPEHYPVCRVCGEPWPCPDIDLTMQVRRETALLDRYMSILPGCCWSCGEPVTGKQKSAEFPGSNLLLIGGPPVVFHTRASNCLAEAIRYERRWVPSAAGRKWRLQCPGRLTVHVDGTECSELGDCPGPGVQHQVYSQHAFTFAGRPGPVLAPGAAGACTRCRDAAARIVQDPPRH